MKKLIAIIAVALPLAFSARAQWIVYDPTSNIQQILDEAENIAEYVDMVDVAWVYFQLTHPVKMEEED